MGGEIIRRYNYVLQQNSNDCSIASLMTVLMYFNIKPNREKLLKSINYKKGNFNAYDIVKMSRVYNLECIGLKTSISRINKFPVIAHVMVDNNFFHFIVIYKIDKKRRVVTVMDPSIGLREIGLEKFNQITTNIFLTFNKTKNIKKENRLKRTFVEIVKTNKKSIFKTLILSLLFILLSLIFNHYLKLALIYNNKTSLFELITIFFIFICILKNIFNHLKNNLELKLNYEIEESLTKKVINHLLNLPYRYFNSKTSGELVSVIEDIESFNYCITKICVLSCIDIFLLLVVLIYIFYLNFRIGLLFAFVLIILYVITSCFKYVLNDSFTPYKVKSIDYNSSLIEILNSIESIKNLNIQDKIFDKLMLKFSVMNKSRQEYYLKINRYGFTNSLFTDMFYIVLVFSCCILFKNNLNNYDIVLYSSIFYMLISSSQNVLDSISIYKVEEQKINRVLDLLEEKKEVDDKKKFSLINKITFKDVSYNGLLKNINIEFKKGDHVFLTGRSGIGKTTLVKLLLKSVKLTSGAIFIDDINTSYCSPIFLRDKITYCGQNENLFKGTIKDNLSLTGKEFHEISKLTLLDRVIEEKGECFALEEYGNNLSGGEKKKLILTRALLKMSEVLILDEATNEISIEEESVILKNIIDKYRDKIIIVISHRTNNMNLFNKKYYLKGDDIIEIE